VFDASGCEDGPVSGTVKRGRESRAASRRSDRRLARLFTVFRHRLRDQVVSLLTLLDTQAFRGVGAHRESCEEISDLGLEKAIWSLLEDETAI
jgi:hypothetical protein